MRLSDILSKPISSNFQQVENFLGSKKLNPGQQRKINVGKVARTYFCKDCDSDVSFLSCDNLFCIGINNRLISIDCVLECPRCNAKLPIWFLIECRDGIDVQMPEVRILKCTEKFSDRILISQVKYGDYSDLLEKAERAYRNELGAGAIVYLRKIFEGITIQMAQAERIETKTEKGRRLNFSDVLKNVDEKCHIIPSEYAENRYKLFGELSDIVHGVKTDEQDGIKKYDALRRLIIGVLDNVKNNRELMIAIGELGWNNNPQQK